jgi:hypothetical protein
MTAVIPSARPLAAAWSSRHTETRLPTGFPTTQEDR